MRRITVAVFICGLSVCGWLAWQGLADAQVRTIPIGNLDKMAGSYLLGPHPQLVTLNADGCYTSNGMSDRLPSPERTAAYESPPDFDDDLYGIPINFHGSQHGVWERTGSLVAHSTALSLDFDDDGTLVSTARVDTVWEFDDHSYRTGLGTIAVSIYSPDQDPQNQFQAPVVDFEWEFTFSRVMLSYTELPDGALPQPDPHEFGDTEQPEPGDGSE